MLSNQQNLLTVEKKTINLIINTRVQEKTNMQDKQKVTLYLQPGLHRQLKIRAAIDADSMSAVVEKAIAFYLQYPDMVDQVERGYGKTHQVHICPECESALVIKDGAMVSIKSQPSVIDEQFPLEKVKIETNSQGEQLVPC